MLWINFLHLYQPANSDSYRIKEAVDLSYKKIISSLEKNKNFKVTLNISGCLVLRLIELKYFDLFSRINKLIDRKQIELVGSAAYHPILPLIKEDEIVWQIKENKRIIKKYFPKAQLKGFFLPEMAYSSKVAKIVKKLNYQWLILDEISFNSKSDLNFNKVYKDKNSGLKIIFRSREFSNCYTPKKINFFLEDNSNSSQKKVVISANDGELYGLRHNDFEGALYKVLQNKKVETILISDYFKNKELLTVNVRSSNWESRESDIAEGEPYHLWYSKKNLIQVKLWKFLFLADKIVKKYKNDKNHSWARWHFVRGLASCAFWWSSANDFKHNFGPVAWNPDEIERGANELIRTVRSLEDSTTRGEKIKLEHLFADIKKMIWTKHWSKK